MSTQQSIIREGCLRFGVDPARLEPLNSAGVFSMDPAAWPIFQYREGGHEYVLKFAEYSPAEFEAASEIVGFVDYLAQHGMRVARPLPSARQRLIEAIESGERIVAITRTRKVDGVHVSGATDQADDAFFREWGRTVGKLHALSRRYAGGRRIPTWKDEIDGIGRLGGDDDVRAVWYEVGAALAQLPQPPDAYGLVHNDLHPENFLYANGQITVMDFDVCHWHWFVLDIAMVVYVVGSGMVRGGDEACQGEAYVRHCFEVFMAGYGQEHQLASFWIRQMPLFLRHRLILPYMLYERGMVERGDPVREPWRQAILSNHQLVRPEIWQEY